MTFNEDKNKTIIDLMNRNLYLESLIFGGNKDVDERLFETPILFIAKESDSGEIRGVFLDEISAQAVAERAENHTTVESWFIQSKSTEPAPPVPVQVGMYVTANVKGKFSTGKVVWCDNDETQGINRVLYKILPKGLPDYEEARIVISHDQIEEVLDD